MAHTRKSEGVGSHRYRSERCVLINGLWYVATREGVDVGPFESRVEAESAAKQIAKSLVNFSAPEAALRFVREYARRLA
jgi:Domain of unknown function (DUF6316)